MLKFNNGQYTLKIIDFGTTKNKDALKTLCGSPLYMAPEMTLDPPYTEKVDSWGAGMIIFYCMTGTFPFNADNFPTLKIVHEKWNPTELLSQETNKFYNLYPHKMWVFLSKLLEKDPVKRITASAAEAELINIAKTYKFPIPISN
jgi:serine/threonine protein kinase